MDIFKEVVNCWEYYIYIASFMSLNSIWFHVSSLLWRIKHYIYNIYIYHYIQILLKLRVNLMFAFNYALVNSSKCGICVLIVCKTKSKRNVWYVSRNCTLENQTCRKNTHICPLYQHGNRVQHGFSVLYIEACC